MDKLGRNLPTIPSGGTRHLYCRLVGSVSILLSLRIVLHDLNMHTDPLIYLVSRRMEIQTCRRKGYSHLGFIDPITCNWRLLHDNIPKLVQVHKRSSQQANDIVSLQLCVSDSYRLTLSILYHRIV